MRELLKFYWFLAKVLFSLKWLLFLTGLNRLKKYKVVIFLTAVSLNLLILIWLNTSEKQKEALVAEPTPPPYANIAVPEGLSRQQTNEKIQQLEAVLALQPTHVDTLINLGLVYDGLGNKPMAESYWSQAYEIDPYHPFFDSVK
jgi:tetratricopeptide (TPR) repeat protein